MSNNFKSKEHIGRKRAYFYGELWQGAPTLPSWWTHEKEDDPPPLPKVYIRDKKTGKRKRVYSPEIPYHGIYD